LGDSDATQTRRRVLVLCTGNSCRSQMAEGFINHLLGREWEARSAGTAPASRVHPLAVRAMAEVGIDIGAGKPEHVDVYLDEPWDLVVTVCDSAQESCPVFPRRVEKIHVSFFDPAAAEGTDEEKLPVFRRVRDEIRDRLLPEVRGRG
jgi:arsenate reductase (thioredoxin)